MKTLTFIDTETGGLGKDAEILEICIVKQSPNHPPEEIWSTLIKPLYPERVEVEALEINGITPDMWKDAPTLEEVAPEIIKRLKFGPIVGHNIQFDIQKLKSNFQRIGINWNPGYPQIDTASLAWIFLPIKRINLDSCRAFLLIDGKGHRAVKDALDTASLFWYILDKTGALCTSENG